MEGDKFNHETMDMIQSIIEIILYICVSFRILEFLRTWRQYRFVIQMILQVFIDLYPFMVIFFYFVAFFSFCSVIL